MKMRENESSMLHALSDFLVDSADFLARALRARGVGQKAWWDQKTMK